MVSGVDFPLASFGNGASMTVSGKGARSLFTTEAPFLGMR